MKKVVLLCCMLFQYIAYSQELFVYTEPASNLPSNALAVRATNAIMRERIPLAAQPLNSVNYRQLVSLQCGVSREVMLSTDIFMGEHSNGAGIYVKYRFFNNDGISRHFRMALYSRVTWVNGHIHQEELDIAGKNTGLENGYIATQLLNRYAISASLSYIKVLGNYANSFPNILSNQSMNYTLSFGRLFWPGEYKNFNQTNINGMIEFLGQSQLQKNEAYLDIAPSIQLIFHSQTRLDIGYKRELYGSMIRPYPNGFLIRFQYLLFNAIRKKPIVSE